MQTQTETTSNIYKDITIEALSQMSSAQLSELYANGRAPKSVNALDGHPKGMMLAVRGLETSLAGIAAAQWFVWDGKSFSKGTGVNRVVLGGRHNLFPFTTSIGPSQVDGKPSVILDYDLADNPALIRKIHDEVREVAPGLFLGPAMWKTANKPVHVLWFALDTKRQSKPVATLN